MRSDSEMSQAPQAHTLSDRATARFGPPGQPSDGIEDATPFISCPVQCSGTVLVSPQEL